MQCFTSNTYIKSNTKCPQQCSWTIQEQGLFYASFRLGRRCAATEGRGKEARAAFDQTFQFHGPRLYNALPRDLRNLTGCGTDFFKEKLDQYLAGIADEPAFPGFIPTGITENGAPSNSLIYQAAGRKEERRNETRRRTPGF